MFGNAYRHFIQDTILWIIYYLRIVPISEILSFYTDFLTIWEDGGAFSWKGDSGKVIVTDDEDHRPVALLWGGWQERLRRGKEQEVWTYGIDLGKVLDRLDLKLLE